MFKLILISLISLGSLTAQTYSGKINPYPEVNNSVRLLDDTIKVLAVIADFQEDRDGSTFGNGKFGTVYSSDYGNEIIDPLPHDAAYFQNHLTFLKNYFYKSSKGKQNISFTVLPQVVTVSKTMRNYSPPPKSEDLTPVADFVKEVWTKVDSANPGFIFSEYEFFIIFHAGAGRDVSLPGSLGNERDLPSVYLGPTALQKIYPGFQGFPVQSGTFGVTNSAIIPETESRELSGIGGTALLELSINGLLAATTASYLQLPDLFDTETGLSAIGRFGLMDGQSIFAYNGLFPPEPSAWEKIYLGWVTPVEASLNNNNYSLVSSGISALTDTSILKVNISSSEYYLIENRQRDVNSDGAVLSSFSNGVFSTISFPKDTTGFRSFDVDSLKGVITDVDEYDWALPGNGIVIWHVDENVINQKIAENKINTDMERRGVDVEEADGIQDIGVQFQTVFGDIVIGEGEERDFWFASNDADLFENKFSTDTRPNTLTNLGAKSLLTISAFSENSNKMSFNITWGDSIIKPVSSWDLSQLQRTNASLLHINSGNPLFALNSSDELDLFNQAGEKIQEVFGFSKNEYKPASFISGDTLFIAGSLLRLNAFIKIGNNPGVMTGILTGSPLTSAPVYRSNGDLLAGASGGKVYKFRITANPFNVSSDSFLVNGINDVLKIAADDEFYSLIGSTGDKFFYSDKNGSLVALDFNPSQILLTKNSDNLYVTAIAGNEKIVFISNGKISSVINKESSDSTSAAFVDLRQDGNNYLVFNDGIKIKAYNTNGALADNFPYSDPAGIGFTSSILAADFENDKSAEIIASTIDGRIFAIFGNSGRIVNGFPLTVGAKLIAHPVLYNSGGSTYLSVLDSTNHLYTWSISPVEGTLMWYEQSGNNSNSSFTSAAGNSNFVNVFFPVDKVYNYPNPVYEGKTYIRYYVAENSKINIKIFDLAGALVDELNNEAVGGSDNETSWDISGVQSGVYIARIEATSGSKTESNIIKIAVVR